MLLDMQSKFCEDQAVTVSAASEDSVLLDLGVGDQGNNDNLEIIVLCSEAATAAGAATVDISLQTADASTFASAETVASSGAIGKAALLADTEHFRIRMPRGMKKYARLYFTVATGPLTAGKFTAFVSNGRDAGFGC